jgi:hypothetical protein
MVCVRTSLLAPIAAILITTTFDRILKVSTYNRREGRVRAVLAAASRGWCKPGAVHSAEAALWSGVEFAGPRRGTNATVSGRQ